MLRMESNHSDTSLNSSERASSAAWVKLWNASYNSTTARLSIDENGSATDLASAIGDKEVAAKAVAFVVNSTRKGIVPLCADVANLLRHKKRLEEKIIQLMKENQALRLLNDERGSLTGSTVTRSKQSEPLDEFCLSAPTSPTACPEQTVTSERRATTGRRRKQSHDDALTLNHITCSAPEYSFMPVTPATESSPRVDNQVIIHPKPSEETQLPATTNITVAEVHVSPEPTTQADHKPVDWPTRPLRTPSLSSSERGSDRSLELSTVQEKHSTSTIAKKLSKTVLSNNKLTEELDAARATIEKLQREVRDLRVFCKNNNHNGADMGLPALRLGPVPDVLPSYRRRTSSRSEAVGHVNPTPSCQICTEAWLAASTNGAVLPRLFTHDDITLFTSENMLVTMEDSVLTNSNQCGTVQYIGHLDGFAPTSLFVGLQLADKVHGGIEGSFNGRRYFNCPKGCGLFIRAQDIVNVITKKQASVLHKSKKPVAVTSNPDKSTTSSSNSGSTGGFVRKLRRAAVNIRHTHSQKRISLPGDTNQTTEPGQSTEVVNNQPKERPVDTNHRRTHSAEGALPEGFV